MCCNVVSARLFVISYDYEDGVVPLLYLLIGGVVCAEIKIARRGPRKCWKGKGGSGWESGGRSRRVQGYLTNNERNFLSLI